MTGMNRTEVDAWITSYERAWRAAGTDQLAALFTDDATYRQAPYREPVEGLAAIGRMWEDEREGPDEVFAMTWEIVAVEDDTAVVRLEVSYGDPVDQEFRDIWIARFAADGRCREFEEWPFWPSVDIAPPDA